MPRGQWTPGDLVQLKSGSPTMTVNHVSDSGNATCHYFDFAKNQMTTVTVASAALMEAQET